MMAKLAIDLKETGAAGKVVERIADRLDHHEQQEGGDGCGRDGLVFAVAVRMIFVRRLSGGPHADQTDDVRGGIGE